MSTAVEKLRAKRARRPVYLMVEQLVRPSTGEVVGAFVPAHPIDQRLCKERKFHKGREVRAELKQPRNVAFHRLAHAVGHLLVDSVAGFESMTAHDALKRIQREAGVCCEMVEFDVGGQKIPAQIARSLSFDEMAEDEFAEFFRGVTDYIEREYLPGLCDGVRADYWSMVEKAA